MKLSDFFKPSVKKLYWLFVVFFAAQLYSTIVLPAFPSSGIASFIDFVLSPASTIIAKSAGIEQQLALPVAATVNLIWEYFLATLLAREVSKDKA